MADRSEPEFDWLYGSRSGQQGPGQQTPPASDPTRAIPVQQRPSTGPDAADAASDGTRVMPTQPRRTTEPPATPPTPPSRPLAPPPGGPSGQGAPRRKIRAKTIRRVVYVLVLAWIAYLVVVPIMAWKSVEKVEFAPDGTRPAEQPGTTYLLVGTDSRAGLTKKQRAKLATGDAEGSRTDTIMLLHTGSGPNLLMSIPRDSLVDIPDHGTNKINAAFAWGGPQLLAQTIEQATGIRIDSYAEIGMGGIVSIVNAVGGITICPEFDMDDDLAGIHVKAGCQHAGGKKALGYARSRHSDPQYGDITRAKHQREVIAAVGKKVASPWSVINPFRYWKLAHAAPKSFAFGEGASPLQAAKWALAMTRTTGSKGMTCGVPISDMAVHWDAERSQKLFDYVKTDRTEDVPKSLCTPTGLPKSVTG
ncbi:LCP family protein [Nocardioides sp.]|uniref:LCP family protein n=1 Tax=Nocardioides sp. TaxID=35761 RepID=UPI0039E65149